MVVINPKSKCDEAKLYYYDYLNNSKKDIPLGISGHIDQCIVCQNEIDKLSRIIAENEDSHKDTEQTGSIIALSLKLHFALENTMVSCQTVKPFLPSLADPLLKIRIPTPVTVHIDKCEKCKENLEAIQGLNLNNKQLSILGQIFAESHPAKERCIKAHESIPRVVALSLSKTTSENLKHICICPDCRAELYRQRDLVIQGLLKSKVIEGNFPCKSVQPTDIFDYCFPYGIDVENDQYVKFRTSFTSHVSVCVTCLSKIQQLHKTISEILERPDSGIITNYRLILNQKTGINNTDNVYTNWPIEVKVYDSSQQNSTESSTVPEPKVRKNPYIGKLAKLLSAAAVVLFLLTLYFNTPAAKAIDLNQIYKALSKLRNVYFAVYTPDKNIPAQEKWMSAELNTILVKTESRIMFWDIKGKKHKLIDLGAGNVQPVQLAYGDWDGIKNMVVSPWGLLPFNNISEVPENSDAQWQKIDNKTVDVTVENAEIYELIWKEQITTGAPIFKKWRGYVDVNTKLLKRIELYEKLDTAAQYELKGIQKIEYPTTAEIEKQIKESGF
jgi:hypothetical protein